MRTQGSTLEIIEVREKVLADVIYEFKRDGKIINWQMLIKEMRRRGYPEYTKMKLYSDRTSLNQKNTYIRDFLPNYSAYQEEINELLDWVIEESKRNYYKKWTNSKAVKRTTPNGETKEVTTTKELAAPKKMFLETIIKAVDLKQKHAIGQNIHISAVVVQKELLENKKKMQQLQTVPPQTAPKPQPALPKPKDDQTEPTS